MVRYVVMVAVQRLGRNRQRKNGVHKLITADGYIAKYEIGRAGEDDREGLHRLTGNMSAITVIGDKGYVGDFLRENMADQGITRIAMRQSK